MAGPVKNQSLYNSVYRVGMTFLMGALATSSIALLSFTNSPVGAWLARDLVANIVVGNTASMVSSYAAITLFNQFLARPSSTVDQPYQEPWIVRLPSDLPHPYAIIQPHHHKRWKLGRDAVDRDRPFKLLGLADTEAMAEQVCLAMTQQPGVMQDFSTLVHHYRPSFVPVLRDIQNNHAVWHQRAVDALTSVWKVARVSPDAPDLVAYRIRNIPDGPRYEFYPAVPQTVTQMAALSHGLLREGLLSPIDLQLPRILPEGSPLAQSPELQTAWTVQRLQAQATIPWTLLNVADSHQTPRWTAGCAVPASDGRTLTWHFYPTPPRTVTDSQQLGHDLRRYSTPRQTPDEWPVAVTPPQDALAQWQALARPRSAVAPAAPTLALRSRSRSL